MGIFDRASIARNNHCTHPSQTKSLSNIVTLNSESWQLIAKDTTKFLIPDPDEPGLRNYALRDLGINNKLNKLFVLNLNLTTLNF